ncbi:MAG: sigma-70 family RNA polymerase sigma factor, partial [Planctomycetota bacterium]
RFVETPIDPVADVVLLQRFLTYANMDAFSAIVDRHQADLLRLAHAITGDADVADDVVQEGFLRLCSDGHGLLAKANERHSLGGWLCTVVRNQCLDHLRRRRTAPLPEQVSQRTPPEGTPVDSGTQLWAAVADLPPLERAAVILRYRDQLDYKLIAERLGKSVSHVGVILNQAMSRLRDNQMLREAVL